jgi:hypothetical protein
MRSRRSNHTSNTLELPNLPLRLSLYPTHVLSQERKQEAEQKKQSSVQHSPLTPQLSHWPSYVRFQSGNRRRNSSSRPSHTFLPHIFTTGGDEAKAKCPSSACLQQVFCLPNPVRGEAWALWKRRT